jgi:hypothetical protein
MPTFQNARALLEASVQSYRRLLAYSDTGKSHRPHCRGERLCEFRTDYRADGNFRFEFETRHPYRRLNHLKSTVVVGSHKGEPYFFDVSYSGEQTLEEPESLDLALAGATGISSGTAHTIGALLFAEAQGFTLLDLRRLRFRRDRVLDGVLCAAVSGLHPCGGRVTAWFGRNDLLLRRLVRSKFRSEELRTDVRTNHELPDSLFDKPRVEASQETPSK